MKKIKSALSALASHTMDLILVIIFITLVLFTIVILWMFVMFEAIPDTLVTCVFTALASECGIMGWIKTAKEKTNRTVLAGSTGESVESSGSMFDGNIDENGQPYDESDAIELP